MLKIDIDGYVKPKFNTKTLGKLLVIAGSGVAILSNNKKLAKFIGFSGVVILGWAVIQEQQQS